MIIYPSNYTISDTRTAFKWMYNFSCDTILISRGRNQHKYIHHEYNQLSLIPEFTDWVRFVHLEKQDFKTKYISRILCVRPTLHDKEKIERVIQFLKIKSPIVWDATNDIIMDLTKNYNERY